MMTFSNWIVRVSCLALPQPRNFKKASNKCEGCVGNKRAWPRNIPPVTITNHFVLDSTSSSPSVGSVCATQVILVYELVQCNRLASVTRWSVWQRSNHHASYSATARRSRRNVCEWSRHGMGAALVCARTGHVPRACALRRRLVAREFHHLHVRE